MCATIAHQKATSDYILRDYSGHLEAPEGVQSRYISKMGGGDVATRGLWSVSISLVDPRSTAETTSILLITPTCGETNTNCGVAVLTRLLFGIRMISDQSA
jgi:hypothetical protein